MNKNNCFCFLKKSDLIYDNKQLYRLNYILSQNNNNETQFNNNVINSLYATNIKFLKCKYPDNIINMYNNKNELYQKIDDLLNKEIKK